MALSYRAYFALSRNPITNTAGFNTTAAYVYTNTLLDILERRSPTHIAAVFDTSAPTHRHSLYPDYKAQREAMPEELSAALPYILRLNQAFHVPVLKLDGYEADDLMGALAKRAEAAGWRTYLVTPDKDFGQIVSDAIFLYKPARMGDGVDILGPAEICARYQLQRPTQMTDLLGLWGDASDNIPGVPGIGEKTAVRLLARYDSLENLLAHTHELKGKQKENLETFADQARLSKKLATILTEVPLDVSLESLARQERDDAALTNLFRELEFNSIGKRLFGKNFHAAPVRRSVPRPSQGSASNEDTNGSVGQMELGLPELKSITDTPHEYHLVDTLAARDALLQKLKACKSFCFDTETISLDPHSAETGPELVGIAFALEPHKGYYVPFPPEADQARALLEAFRPIFEDPAIEKIGHNLKFDLSVLYRDGDIEVKGPLFDTFLAHALIEPEQRHGLDRLAETYLSYSPIPITQLIGPKGPEQLSMREVPIDKASEYAVEDADLALQLKPLFEAELKSKQQGKVFYEIECPLLPILVRMEATGIALDAAALASYSKALDADIHQLAQRIQDLAGTAFNLNSPKQLGQVLFDILKLDSKAKKTRTGQYATSEQVLARLAPQHEIVSKILEHRALAKLKSTYVDALPAAVSARTRRLHTNYSQVYTVTGRLQSSGPNLQNIPIRTQQGREIRKAFIPAGSGYCLLSADYSQIELRIIASLSQDAALCAAFREGMDIHTATAARVYSVTNEEVTSEMRRKAKMVNFGIPYGISAFGLAQRLGASRTEAAELIDAYFNQFPGIRGYIDNTLGFAREHGYVETLTGRRRYLSDIRSANATVRASAERNAVNMPIQGTAADMIKIAMIHIHNAFKEGRFRTQLLLQVHDELVFDLYMAEKDTVVLLIEEAMKNALPLEGVPIAVETGIGANWLEAH